MINYSFQFPVTDILKPIKIKNTSKELVKDDTIVSNLMKIGGTVMLIERVWNFGFILLL